MKLDGIGTLYLGASSTGADSSEDFDISKNITRIGVKFLADQSKNSIYTARVMRQSNTLTTKIGLEGGHLVDGSGSGNNNDTPNPGAVEEEP